MVADPLNDMGEGKIWCSGGELSFFQGFFCSDSRWYISSVYSLSFIYQVLLGRYAYMMCMSFLCHLPAVPRTRNFNNFYLFLYILDLHLARMQSSPAGWHYSFRLRNSKLNLYLPRLHPGGG